MKTSKEMRMLIENFNKFLNESPNLKNKMMEYLKNKFRGLMNVESEDFNFSAEAAIYWFATDYHGGQWSELYSILSSSKYKPSILSNNVTSEPEDVQELYSALEDKYKNLSENNSSHKIGWSDTDIWNVADSIKNIEDGNLDKALHDAINGNFYELASILLKNEIVKIESGSVADNPNSDYYGTRGY